MSFLGKLARPPVMITAGIGVVGATTFILIQMFLKSLLLGLLLLLVLALAAVIVLLVRQLRAARAAEEIETTITRQANRDIERSVPGQAAELEDMKDQLLEAIEALKSSKVGRRHGKAVLSLLPWYMVVGPPRGGKGALLQRSGLHFPLADERRNPRSVRGVGGTRSLEWWLAEEAVLLDMPGRLLTTAEFEDTEDWIAFLDVLRQQRKKRPLNGVLVAVGLDQIAELPEKEVETLGRRVRERVQELVHHLGVVFPTYVVFTRCDLVAGFAEFFGALSSGERRQPWGAVIPVARARDRSAESVFEAEFQELVRVLSERRLARLGGVPDPFQRARAFGFPGELERLGPRMRRLVQALFEPDRAEEGPLFRGFFLTSAAPEGRPADRLLAASAQGLGLAVPETPAPPALDPGPWFLGDLFPKIVFPDAGLAVESGRAGARRLRARTLLFAGLGAVFLALTLTLSVLSCANHRLIDRTRRAVQAVDQRVGTEASLMRNLLALEELRAQVAAVDSLSRRKPLWRRVSAYSGDAIRDPAVRFYIDRTLQGLVGPGLARIEQRLRDRTASGGGPFYRYFFLFRAWRLLGEPQHLDRRDAMWVANELESALESSVEAERPEDRARFGDLVRRQVAFLCAHPEEVARLAPRHRGPLDVDLRRRAATRVRDTWDSSQFYLLIVREAAGRTKPLGLTELIGETGMLEGSVSVPGPFTLEGWHKEMRPRIQAFNDLMQRDWVVEDAFREVGAGKPDVARELRRLYARDYARHWVEFLVGVQAPRPSDLAAAAQALKQAQRDDSPLFKTLRAVRDQTRIDVAEPDLGQVAGDFGILEAFFAGEGSVGAGAKGVFQRAKELVGMGGDKSLLDPSRSPKVKYQELLKSAHQKVEEAAQPGAPASKLRELLAEGGDAPNPLKQLVAYVGELAAGHPGAGAQPVSRVLTMLVTGAMGTTGGALSAEIHRKWEQLVALPFQRTLAGKYPVVEEGADATLEDFKEFFRPQGTFWSFYESELKAYVSEDGTPVGAEGASAVSPGLQACVKRAYQIRQALFSASGEGPGMRFDVRTSQPRIDGPPVVPYWTILDLGGQSFNYQMGQSRWESLSWPGADPNVGARARANAGGAAVEPRAGPGVWGLFRLLDQGQFSTSAEGHPQTTLRLDAGAGALLVTYEFRPASVHHPFRPGSLRFALPASL